MLPEFELLTPADLASACRILKERGAHAGVLAGGTRLVADARQGMPPPAFLVDLADVAELRFRYRGTKRIHVGPLVRLADLAAWTDLSRYARAAVLACEAVRPAAVRAQGTIGGALLSRPPSGDAAVALLALDARLRLKSTRGERDLSLDRLWDLNGRLAVNPDEIVTDVAFNPADARTDSGFEKIGERTATRPADAVLALRITLSPSAQVIHEFRLAYQTGEGFPRRASAAEQLAGGARLSAETLRAVVAAALDAACPGTLTERSLREAVEASLARMLDACLARIRERLADLRPLLGSSAAPAEAAPAAAG